MLVRSWQHNHGSGHGSMEMAKLFKGYVRLQRTCHAVCLVLMIGLTALVPVGVHADYKLGSGDVVRISVYGQEDLTIETRIPDSQSIPFPLIGNIAIGGLSPTAAQALIADRLRSGGFVKAPQVNLMIAEFNSQQVSVLGHVKNPGQHTLRGSERVLDMIAAAGGVDERGDDRVIVVQKDKNRRVIDLPMLFENGDLSQNFAVADGDMIYVPRAPVFYVYGEVRQPGSYRLERDMTVMQAISVGGGLTARGTDSDLKIKRHDADGIVKTVPANLVDKLQSGDVILVKESIF